MARLRQPCGAVDTLSSLTTPPALVRTSLRTPTVFVCRASMALQSPSVLSTTTSPISGPYAFGMAGYSSVTAVAGPCYAIHTCGPISLAGAMTVGAGGAISTGTEDVMVAENNGSAIAFSGSMGSAGEATDSSGRVTASIHTAVTANMPSWPSNFVIYAHQCKAAFHLTSSTDSYVNNSLIAGAAIEAESRQHCEQSVQCDAAHRLVRQPHVNHVFQHKRTKWTDPRRGPTPDGRPKQLDERHDERFPMGERFGHLYGERWRSRCRRQL